MQLGFILWLIFIFVLCCGAAKCLGVILLSWTLAVSITVVLCLKGKIKS